MFFNDNDHRPFFDVLAENGFHFFSRGRALHSGYYPHPFPPVPEVALTDIRLGDRITVRAFFMIGSKVSPRVDSGLLDLEVEAIDPVTNTLSGNILTALPTGFALAQGTTVEVFLDEVLLVQAGT